jgi:hypothetical protein
VVSGRQAGKQKRQHYENVVLMIPMCASAKTLQQRDRQYELTFYLPHMEYEGSVGFVSRKMKKKIADLIFLDFLWKNNMF